MPAPLITLLTDFGSRDPYVGVMKGVLLRTAPDARLVDLTHEIDRQDVSGGSFWLEKSAAYFPRGTIHLVVVDPGVGTTRRAIAFERSGQIFVGPDNGIFTDLLASGTSEWGSAVVLDRALIHPNGRRGTTFDGRDLFAPAAALLARGEPLTALGPSTNPTTIATFPEIYDPARPRVRVIDHYGNLLTDAPSPIEDRSVIIQGRSIPWATTYGDARDDGPIALRGSWGTVEIATNGGSAQQALGAVIGTQIELK